MTTKTSTLLHYKLLLHHQFSSLLPSNLHNNSSQNSHKSSSISSTAIPSQQPNHSNPITTIFSSIVNTPTIITQNK